MARHGRLSSMQDGEETNQGFLLTKMSLLSRHPSSTLTNQNTEVLYVSNFSLFNMDLTDTRVTI